MPKLIAMTSGTEGGLSQFDPIELLGSRIPFIDPFSYNDHDFRASGSVITFSGNEGDSGPPQGLSLVDPVALRYCVSLARTPVQFVQCDTQPFEYDDREFTILDREPLYLELGSPCPDTRAELPDVVPEQVRSRLSADQAIHIFSHRSTKNKHTATLLAAEYGISPKAIRDIWARRSWSRATRPYWTHLDV